MTQDIEFTIQVLFFILIILKFSWLERKFQKMVDQAVQDLVKAIDDATTAIANRITKILAASGTADADLKAALQPEIDKLTALGADPANPVPVVDPVPNPQP